LQNVNASENSYRFRCQVTSSCCIAYSGIASILVAPLPLPPLKTNSGSMDICGLSSLTISTDSGYKSYLWNNNASGLAITVSQPGVYSVAVTDSNNCLGKDSIAILPCEKFVVPNAFTPNHDGKNDEFKPVIFGGVDAYQFSIFNRWGQLVFRTTDSSRGWDGTVDGVAQQAGVFVWSCRFQLLGYKVQTRSGTVVLIR